VLGPQGRMFAKAFKGWRWAQEVVLGMTSFTCRCRNIRNKAAGDGEHLSITHTWCHLDVDIKAVYSRQPGDCMEKERKNTFQFWLN